MIFHTVNLSKVVSKWLFECAKLLQPLNAPPCVGHFRLWVHGLLNASQSPTFKLCRTGKYPPQYLDNFTVHAAPVLFGAFLYLRPHFIAHTQPERLD